MPSDLTSGGQKSFDNFYHNRTLQKREEITIGQMMGVVECIREPGLAVALVCDYTKFIIY